MKKSIKILLTTIALAIACVSPVFATEKDLTAELKMINDGRQSLSNAISTLVTYDNNCGADAKNSIHHLVDLTQANVKSSSITERQNYINYLKAVVGNAIETERVKKANVNALTDLVKVNPSFQAQLDAAVAEYNKAVADHAAAEAAIAEAQKAFDANKDMNIAAKDAKAAADPDAIK